jgi:hypothetical protein
MAKDLDPITRDLLRQEGLLGVVDRVQTPKDMPASAAFGLPNLQIYKDPSLAPGAGYVISPNERTKAEQLYKVHRQTPAIFLEPNLTADKGAIGHETDHLLARAQLGKPSAINTLFDSMANDPKQGRALRSQFVQDAAKVYPYLKEKYGLDSMYFQPEMIKYQGPIAPNLAFEMMADLVGIEAKTGTDITKDPYLRKNLFKDRETREIFNALTGLRQTRLDAKDLPPHTRQKETGSGFFSDVMEKLKRKDFGKKAGGSVDKPLPGGNKLI